LNRVVRKCIDRCFIPFLTFDTGLPMKLTFFVHPCEILKSPSLFSAFPSEQEHKVESDDPEVGVSAKVLLEPSSKIYPLSIDPHLFE